MAETKKAALEIEVDTGNSVNSLKTIKAELKAAQSAALSGNQDAIKKVAELKDKLDDLKDSTKSLQGSGVEKVTSSFGLLGEGFKNFDFDKIKTGFKGIGSAMSAIPIFLIAEGISYLVENWKELGEGNGIVAKGIQLLNTAFDEIGKTISTFTDLIGLTNTKLEEQGEIIKTNADKSKEALSGTIAEYDRQLKVAKANGQDTIDLEKKKQEAIIQTNVTIAKQIEAFVRAGGVLDDEKKKLLTASLEAIKNAKTDEIVLETEHTKKVNEEAKKRSDEKKKKAEDDVKTAEDLFKSLSDQQDKEAEKELARREKEKSDRAKHLEELDALQLKADQEEVARKVEMWAAEDKRKADELASEQKLQQDRLNLASASANSLIALNEIVFSIRSQRLVKGSAEEERVARRNFQINKALQLTLAGIDGAKAITSILAQYPKFDGGVAMAAALISAGTATITSIAKISKAKFEPGASSIGDTSAPSINFGGGGNTSAPNTQAPTTNSQPFTRLDESGRNQGLPTIKAYVVESEMTDKQKRVGKLEGQASFG